jgi:hypothetical protein
MKTEGKQTLARGLLLMAAMAVITLALLVNSSKGSSRADLARHSEAAFPAALVAHYQGVITQYSGGSAGPFSSGTAVLFPESGPPAIDAGFWVPRYFYFHIDGTLRVEHSSDFLGTPRGLHLIDMRPSR